MNYSTKSLEIHYYLSPYSGLINELIGYGIEDVNMGKGKA